MTSHFDKDKYKEIIKKESLTQNMIVEKLKHYGIEISIGGVKNWTRTSLNAQGEIYQPELETLKALADICKCSIQDFFSDADVKREQIAFEELSKKPEKYSNSALSSYLLSIPNGEKLKKLIESFHNLTQEQQDELLSQVQDMALQNMKF